MPQNIPTELIEGGLVLPPLEPLVSYLVQHWQTDYAAIWPLLESYTLPAVQESETQLEYLTRVLNVGLSSLKGASFVLSDFNQRYFLCLHYEEGREINLEPLLNYCCSLNLELVPAILEHIFKYSPQYVFTPTQCFREISRCYWDGDDDDHLVQEDIKSRIGLELKGQYEPDSAEFEEAIQEALDDELSEYYNFDYVCTEIPLEWHHPKPLEELKVDWSQHSQLEQIHTLLVQLQKLEWPVLEQSQPWNENNQNWQYTLFLGNPTDLMCEIWNDNQEIHMQTANNNYVFAVPLDDPPAVQHLLRAVQQESKILNQLFQLFQTDFISRET